MLGAGVPDWLYKYRVLPFHSFRMCHVLAVLILGCDAASAGQMTFSFLSASTLVFCACASPGCASASSGCARASPGCAGTFLD
jgi:hypothetical protein